MSKQLQQHRLCKYCVITTYQEKQQNPKTFWGVPQINVERTVSRCHRYPPVRGYTYINNPDDLGCGEFELKNELDNQND